VKRECASLIPGRKKSEMLFSKKGRRDYKKKGHASFIILNKVVGEEKRGALAIMDRTGKGTSGRHNPFFPFLCGEEGGKRPGRNETVEEKRHYSGESMPTMNG